jgi:hypothetical protein
MHITSISLNLQAYQMELVIILTMSILFKLLCKNCEHVENIEEGVGTRSGIDRISYYCETCGNMGKQERSTNCARMTPDQKLLDQPICENHKTESMVKVTKQSTFPCCKCEKGEMSRDLDFFALGD